MIISASRPVVKVALERASRLPNRTIVSESLHEVRHAFENAVVFPTVWVIGVSSCQGIGSRLETVCTWLDLLGVCIP